MSLITVRNLTKEYSRPKTFSGSFGKMRSLLTTKRVVSRAVQDISFEIHKGEMVGYLGANGAGKSTTIKMLAGVLVPSSGILQVAGLVPWRERRSNAMNIGAVFGQRSQLWFDLPLRDSFDLIAKLYGIDQLSYRRRLGELVEILEMRDFLDVPVRSLSLGQRMRGDFVAATLHDPPLLFLDEPTVGLDVVAKARIRDFIAETNAKRSTTVVLTSHDLGDIERLCDRVIIIDKGSVLYDGGLAMLTRRYTPYRELTVLVRSSNAFQRPAEHLQAFSDETIGDIRTVKLRFDPAEISASAAIQRVSDRNEILDLAISEPSLEAVISEIYGTRTVRSDDA